MDGTVLHPVTVLPLHEQGDQVSRQGDGEVQMVPHHLLGSHGAGLG